MKVDLKAIVGLVGALLVALLTFIAGKVWEGVEIAQRNQTKLEIIGDNQREFRASQKEIRSDLDRLYGAVSENAE